MDTTRTTRLEFVETRTDGIHILEVGSDFVVRFAGVLWL